MLKRFLLAAIVSLIVLSSQIAAAADIDWDSVPHFSNNVQLSRYIENERRKGNTTIHFVLNYFKVNNNEELIKFGDDVLCDRIALAISGTIFVNNYETGNQFTYAINEYPGTRVANAYLSSNQQQAWINLTNEEKKLYNIAVSIVDEANKLFTEREKAEYIHNEICRRAKGYKNRNDKNKTAIGALINGYAQCQGFADAFYMLGRMCGLNVGKIGGVADGDRHAWNWITFNDGKSYCIDVTNGVNSKEKYLFCATKERIEKTHSCDWEIIPNLQ